MSDRDPLSEIVVPPYEGPKPKKLFVGIRVSVPTANALASAVETIARRAGEAKIDLRYTSPTTYHVTLRYLGWTRPEILPALRDKLGEAVRGFSPFAFRTSRVGHFPTVIWAGIEEPKQLAELAARIDRVAVELGFAAENRPFQAHVTLARARESRPLKDVVLPVSEQMFSETKVDGITIIESETKSSGSVYSDVAKIAFKSTETGREVAVKRQGEALSVSAPHDMPDGGIDTDDGWPRGQGPTD